MRVISVILAALLLFGAVELTVPAKATLVADQPYRFDPSGRIVTDVYVNGQGPFTFLIDTASSRSLIFEHVRAKLGLNQSGPQLLTIYGINDISTAMPVQPRELRVAGEAITGLTVGVLPNPANPADEPDGVLGIDALARYFVVLDRVGMRFKLITPGSDVAHGYDDWAHVPLTPHQLKHIPLDFWYVDARYNGVRVTTLFDLGASVTLLNWQAAELLGMHKNDYRNFTTPERLRDVLGTDAPVVRIVDLQVAMPGVSWDKPLTVVSGAPVFSWFNLDEKPAAIMGMGVFRDNSLAMDFAGHRLYVGPAVVPPK